MTKLEQINKNTRNLEQEMWRDLGELSARRKAEIAAIQSKIQTELQSAQAKTHPAREVCSSAPLAILTRACQDNHDSALLKRSLQALFAEGVAA